jgi:hypothetical protein
VERVRRAAQVAFLLPRQAELDRGFDSSLRDTLEEHSEFAQLIRGGAVAAVPKKLLQSLGEVEVEMVERGVGERRGRSSSLPFPERPQPGFHVSAPQVELRNLERRLGLP